MGSAVALDDHQRLPGAAAPHAPPGCPAAAFTHPATPDAWQVVGGQPPDRSRPGSVVGSDAAGPLRAGRPDGGRQTSGCPEASTACSLCCAGWTTRVAASRCTPWRAWAVPNSLRRRRWSNCAVSGPGNQSCWRLPTPPIRWVSPCRGLLFQAASQLAKPVAWSCSDTTVHCSTWMRRGAHCSPGRRLTPTRRSSCSRDWRTDADVCSSAGSTGKRSSEPASARSCRMLVSGSRLQACAEVQLPAR